MKGHQDVAGLPGSGRRKTQEPEWWEVNSKTLEDLFFSFKITDFLLNINFVRRKHDSNCQREGEGSEGIGEVLERGGGRGGGSGGEGGGNRSTTYSLGDLGLVT